VLDLGNLNLSSQAVDWLVKGNWRKLVRVDIGNMESSNVNKISGFGVKKLQLGDFPLLFTLYLCTCGPNEIGTATCKVKNKISNSTLSKRHLIYLISGFEDLTLLCRK
jgi:hypothetical protein